MRDTEQPCEKYVSRQVRPPQTSTRSRTHKQSHSRPRTLHEVRELHPTVPPRTTPRNGLQNQRSGVCTRHPERSCNAETANTAHEAKPTKPTTLDTARLQPPCRLEQRDSLRNNVRNFVTARTTKPPPQATKRGTHRPHLQLASRC
ncbi:hypothetical protein Taro_044622 [Colocasia esculenta]|uniref:Uncharacterized protein n=1 Tax=Colocasia esculenta TaxID=4460 RepID=A0A843WJP8_COLES|nr:hypothetical protein [Colocasia esculenta]